MIESNDLEQHLHMLLTKYEHAQIIAFHDERDVHAPEQLVVNARACRIVHAPSELALRHAIWHAKQQENTAHGDVLVIVTPMSDQVIGDDLKANFLKRRLLDFDPWETVRTMLQANQIDDRLRSKVTLGRHLIRHATHTKYTPVKAGWLSEELAWQRLLCDAFELPEDLGDLLTWMLWSIEHPDGLRRLLRQDDLIEDLLPYLTTLLGPSFETIWANWQKHADTPSPGQPLLLTGLAYKAYLNASQPPLTSERHEQLLHIKFMLLQEFGLTKNQSTIADQLSQLATQTYDQHHNKTRLTHNMGNALDDYLVRTDAAELFAHSPISQKGWHLRLTNFAKVLNDTPQEAQLTQALAEIEAHHEADHTSNQRLMRHLYHAARLAFKLAYNANAIPHGSAREMAQVYIDSSSFEDLIRNTLSTYDFGHAELQQAVRQRLDQAAEIRSTNNAHFAQMVKKDLAQQSSIQHTLSIQDVLKQVVVPVAQSSTGVLLIVLDGMSWAVLRTLLHDPTLKRWQSMVYAHNDVHIPMMAALPSVTNLSRTSLLCGEIKSGKQDAERNGFEKNHRLLAAIPKQKRIKLFHKKDLDAQGTAMVGQTVQETILDQKTAIVGVVLNSIDDQLDGAQQLSLDWSVDAIPSLKLLLSLAEQSQRTVILASDHGHVLDDNTTTTGAVSQSARYRTKTTSISPGEVELQSQGIKQYTGEDSAVLLHDERLRYTTQKRGYHGGVSMPEVITPLVVLTSGKLAESPLPPKNFCELMHAPPQWWYLQQPSQPVQVPTHLQPVEDQEVKPKQQTAPQLDLLSTSEPESPPVAPSSPVDIDDIKWVETLLNSTPYIQQRERFHSLPIAPDDVYRVLVTLSRHDNMAHVNQLARTLERAENRVTRLITAMSRVLNLDGYNILSLDRKEHLVRLDKALLFKQFNLDQTP